MISIPHPSLTAVRWAIVSRRNRLTGAIVILSAAKDLAYKGDATEILRCAQDDEYFTGP